MLKTLCISHLLIKVYSCNFLFHTELLKLHEREDDEAVTEIVRIIDKLELKIVDHAKGNTK